MTATGLAAFVQRFGIPEVMQFEAITGPAPDVGHVRIRVDGATVAQTVESSG